MASYKEIVTKAVLGKGKKTFVDIYSTVPSCTPTTVLGCWVINHLITVGDKHLKNPYITRA